MVQILRPENLAPLIKASGTQITMAATYNGETTRINLGSAQYKLSTALVLDTGVSGAGGIIGSYTASTIWNIFAIVSNGSIFLTATTATSPSGFTRYKFLGKFISTNAPAAISHVMNKGEAFVEYLSNSSSTDASDTTNFVHNIDGSSGHLGVTALSDLRRKRVRALAAFTDNDSMVIEVRKPASTNWMPMIGYLGDTSSNTYTQPPIMIVAVSGGTTVSCGVGIERINATDMDVNFGRYSFNTTGYTNEWNGTDFSGARWRVKKVGSIITGP